MHGLGNDFMVIDGVNQKIIPTSELIASWAQRNTGVGFDQCLIIEASHREGIDFNYRIFNANGQEVGQCGNGARCLALFARQYGLTTKNNLTVATKTTQMKLEINEDHSVSVAMGIPLLAPETIPLIAEQQARDYQLELANGESISVHAINVGNPHAVIVVNEIDSAPVHRLGPLVSHHLHFPEQTNVGFMQIINPSQIKLRVYERGSGETLACGSGAVAATAIGRLYHGLTERVTVSLLGGDLVIDWPNPKQSIVMTGPAQFVYDGTLLNY